MLAFLNSCVGSNTGISSFYIYCHLLGQKLYALLTVQRFLITITLESHHNRTPSYDAVPIRNSERTEDTVPPRGSPHPVLSITPIWSNTRIAVNPAG